MNNQREEYDPPHKKIIPKTRLFVEWLDNSEKLREGATDERVSELTWNEGSEG